MGSLPSIPVSTPDHLSFAFAHIRSMCWEIEVVFLQKVTIYDNAVRSKEKKLGTSLHLALGLEGDHTVTQ